MSVALFLAATAFKRYLVVVIGLRWASVLLCEFMRRQHPEIGEENSERVGAKQQQSGLRLPLAQKLSENRPITYKLRPR